MLNKSIVWKEEIMKITRLKIRGFIELNLGVFLAAISVGFFLDPNNMAAGGVSGLGIVLQELLDIKLTVLIYIINIILVIASFFLMGKEFFLKTSYGVIVYPVFLSIVQLVMKQFSYPELDMFLIVIFASLIMGVGMGLAYRNGGTTGGGDIIQAIMLKFFHVPYSKTMYVFDGLVVLCGCFLFGIEATLCAIIYIAITGQIVDAVTFGGYNKRSVYIVTKKTEEVSEFILKKLVRGITKLDAHGGFSNEPKAVILCLLSSNEYFELRSFLDKIDSEAFLFVNKATEVRGYGFSLDSLARISAKKKSKG